MAVEPGTVVVMVVTLEAVAAVEAALEVLEGRATRGKCPSP